MTEEAGYSGSIRFATDGGMQMHLAERNLDVAFKNGQTINPVDRGHIAFRTDDIAAFLKLLDENMCRTQITERLLPRNGIRYFFTIPKAM